jgi:hypothetical protein
VTTLAERQAEFCSYFMPAYPMRSAAAIGGNATQENKCLPVTEGAKDHGSDGALQWRAERLDGPKGLKAYASLMGIPWDTLKTQAYFTMNELDSSEYAILKGDLRLGLKSLETLTLNFCDKFERPSTAGRAEAERIRFAHDCQAILMRDHPAPTPDPTSTQHGVPMPTSIEIALLEQLFKLLAPLLESAVAGLIKGLATHIPGAVVNPAGMVTIDPAGLIKLIEAEVAKIQTGKPL